MAKPSVQSKCGAHKNLPQHCFGDLSDTIWHAHIQICGETGTACSAKAKSHCCTNGKGVYRRDWSVDLMMDLSPELLEPRGTHKRPDGPTGNRKSPMAQEWDRPYADMQRPAELVRITTSMNTPVSAGGWLGRRYCLHCKSR